MKTRNNTIKIVGAVLTVLFCISATSTALAFVGGGHNVHGKGIFKIFKKLDLSDTQKEQIKGILQQNRKARQELTGKLSAFRQANAETKDSFGEAQARADFQKMVPVMEDLFVLKQRTRSQINVVLTPEQCAKLEKIRTERRSKHQAKRKVRQERTYGGQEKENL
jgi:protein CpxP